MTGKNRRTKSTRQGPGSTGRKGLARRCNARSKQREKKRQTQPLVFVQPKSCDVLMGKGPGFVNHPGNIRFQELTDAKYAAYNGARCKQVRASVREEVVAAIRKTGGRFLSMDEDTGRWFEVSKKVAEEKVAMSIRNTRRKTPITSTTSSNNGGIMATNIGAAGTPLVPLTPLTGVWLAGVPLVAAQQIQLSGALVNGATLLYPSWPIVGVVGPSAAVGASGCAVPVGNPAENIGHLQSRTNVDQATQEVKEPITEEIATEEV